MPTSILSDRGTRPSAALQHADDLQRDRAVRRPAAARRLPAASDPLPASGAAADRRLRRHLADPRGRCPSPANRRKICWVTTCDTWPRHPAPRSRSAGTSTTRPAWALSSVKSPRPSTRSSGCVGHITSGCPRDLDEVRALGFQLFGLNPCVSHAYVRLVDFGTPVNIAGVEIRTGDLIHADKHGVCLIPHEIAPKLAEACAEVERRERPLLESCRSDEFLARRVHQAQGRHALQDSRIDRASTSRSDGQGG